MIATDGGAALHEVRATWVGLGVSEIDLPCGEGKCVAAALELDRFCLPQLHELVAAVRRASAAEDAPRADDA